MLFADRKSVFVDKETLMTKLVWYVGPTGLPRRVRFADFLVAQDTAVLKSALEAFVYKTEFCG